MNKLLMSIIVLGMASMTHGVLLVDFENTPPLPPAPEFYSDAGPMQIIDIAGFVTISGGVPLGNMGLWIPFSWPPNSYATSDGYYDLQPNIVMDIYPSFHVCEVNGVLVNGNNITVDYLVEAYCGDSLVDSQFFPDVPRFGLVIFSVVNDPITRIVITPESMTNWNFLVDSITFVPEPGTMALLGLGGLVLLRKRRS